MAYQRLVTKHVEEQTDRQGYNKRFHVQQYSKRADFRQPFLLTVL